MRRFRGLLLVLVVAALAAGVLGVDVAAPPVEPAAAARAAPAGAPVAGTWTCAVGDRREGTELMVLGARPGALGDPPATMAVDVFDEGALRTASLPQLFPGTHAASGISGGARLGVLARWSGAPAALFREWRLEAGEDEDADLPPGTVAGGCTRAVADRWIVPGMITTGGSDARLRLANPFRTDATVAVGFLTPQGAEEPIALQNLTVPARGTREISVNEVLPEREDLSAVVRVLAGRIAVEGYQLTRSAIGDVDGASLLAPTNEPAELWTLPWVLDGEASASWLWVANLGERPAAVELTLNTERGGIVPEGLAEVTVPPGTLRRVDLRGTLPDGVASSALTLRSDGAPVYVSAAIEVAPEEVEETGFVVQLASAHLDRHWIVGGGDTTGRQEALRLVNPTGEPTEVDVVFFNGVTALQPDELSGITVPAGSHRTVDVTGVVGQVRHWSAFVTATGEGVVVGRVGSGGEGALHLVATPGVPASAWQPLGGGLAASAEPGVTQRIHTSLGVERVDPFAPPAREERSDAPPAVSEPDAGADEAG